MTRTLNGRALCICPAHTGWPCEADATAEDLRCDRCRGGGCQLVVDGCFWRHVLIA